MRKVILILGVIPFLVAAASAQTTAVFNASRSSGPAPLPVFFDATQASCANCGDAFHELHYHWDFGDAGAGTWTVSGKPKNEAYGPLAAHVFESPGNHTVRLTVTDNQGTVRSATLRISVQDPDVFWSGSKTVCFSTSGKFDAGTPCDPRVNPGVRQQVVFGPDALIQAHAACSSQGANRCLFRSGERFKTTREIGLKIPGPGLIGAYGPSAQKPHFVASGNHAMFGVSPAGTDWRIVGVEVQGSGGADHLKSHIIRNTGSAGIGRVLVMGTKATPATWYGGASMWNTTLPPNSPMHHEVFFVENDWQNMGTKASGVGGNIATVVAEKVAILGNTWRDTASGGTRGGHILRTKHVEKAIVSHNHMGEPVSGTAVLTLRAAALTCSSGSHAGCGGPSKELLISDNRFGLTQAFQIEFVRPSGAGGSMRDLIFERNFIEQGASQHPAGLRIGVYMWAKTGSYLDGVTIRDNIVNLTGWTNLQHGFVRGGSVAPTNLRIYNNTCYSADWASGKGIKCVQGTPNGIAYNNLLYAPAAGNTTVCGSGPDCRANLDAKSNPFAVANPSRPADFRLKAGSAAVDAGISVGADGVDFNQGVRPAGSGIDVGAMERGAGGAAPPPPGPASPPAPPVLLP